MMHLNTGTSKEKGKIYRLQINELLLAFVAGVCRKLVALLYTFRVGTTTNTQMHQRR